MYDAHMHLGFFTDPLAVAKQLEAEDIEVLCATVEPAEYERLEALGLPANVHLGVGLHPRWVADGSCGATEIERVAELAANNTYVAEIGLDFNCGREEQGEVQVVVFERMLEACSNGDHVLSIHAVNAAGEVLDLLQKHNTCANNQVIFHWFSGSSYELMRARKLGCYFSVGPRMLETKRGRAYAEQIERDHLLLETDLPVSSAQGAELSVGEYLAALRDTASQLGL